MHTAAMTTHPFDRALALDHSDLQAGLFTGATSPDYWNMVGPFGGTTAALAMQAVLRHPDRLGEPIAITVNYAAAVVAGRFEIRATPVKTNRSTQHWTVEIHQNDAEGRPQLNTTATLVTAVRRETWSATDLPMPAVPAPEAVERLTIGPKAVAWVSQYEMRPVSGSMPTQWDGSGDHSLTQLWMRDTPPRPLDFVALAALADVFFPRVWLRRARQVPAGTVSITVYFHATAQQLQATGTGFLLGQARGQEFRNGFFDQTVQLWNEAGTMLATSHQIVYYKE